MDMSTLMPGREDRRIVQRRYGRDRRSLSRADPEVSDRRRVPSRRCIQMVLESRRVSL